MLVDFRQLEKKEIDADLCIVGAGAAGITLARVFTGTGIRVCLLESGGFEYDARIQELYSGEDTGFHEPYGLAGSRLRYFGGTTNHWVGRCAPLAKMDFEVRPGCRTAGGRFEKQIWIHTMRRRRRSARSDHIVTTSATFPRDFDRLRLLPATKS